MNILKFITTKLTSMTTAKQSSTLQSSGSAEETPKSDYSNIPITNEEIPGTPFRILGNPQVGYFVALGMHRLTETMPNLS